MLMRSFVAFVLIIHGAHAGCTKDLQYCVQLFFDNMLSHPSDTKLVCQDMNVLIKCAIDSCKTSASQVTETINRIRNDLQQNGVDCVIDPLKFTTSIPLTTRDPSLTWAPNSCEQASIACTKTYMDSTAGNANPGPICPQVNQFVNCLISTPCEVKVLQDTLSTLVKEELKKVGVNCDININKSLSTRQPAATWPTAAKSLAGGKYF
ncbi:uncharacterized protein LOC131932268 [Physella acuta]|uniref:uncharacterized protein LOC131932268 n=1 Tax=Physella acuta TaxID=109671 RepID=UPI0027DCB287|nr:uncharacterized protein LOC131932268 [Physella acuta]